MPDKQTVVDFFDAQPRDEKIFILAELSHQLTVQVRMNPYAAAVINEVQHALASAIIAAVKPERAHSEPRLDWLFETAEVQGVLDAFISAIDGLSSMPGTPLYNFLEDARAPASEREPR